MHIFSTCVVSLPAVEIAREVAAAAAGELESAIESQQSGQAHQVLFQLVL
jgi:hypothetical protein